MPQIPNYLWHPFTILSNIIIDHTNQHCNIKYVMNTFRKWGVKSIDVYFNSLKFVGNFIKFRIIQCYNKSQRIELGANVVWHHDYDTQINMGQGIVHMEHHTIPQRVLIDKHYNENSKSFEKGSQFSVEEMFQMQQPWKQLESINSAEVKHIGTCLDG